MKKQLYLFWTKVMIWESKRLRRKAGKLATRLSYVCDAQYRHNERLRMVEELLKVMLDASKKDN